MPAAALQELITAALDDALAQHAPGDGPREILDRRGAADLLGVSLPQLDRLAASGRIRRHMLGESPRYLRSELLEDLRGAR